LLFPGPMAPIDTPGSDWPQVFFDMFVSSLLYKLPLSQLRLLLLWRWKQYVPRNIGIHLRGYTVSQHGKSQYDTNCVSDSEPLIKVLMAWLWHRTPCSSVTFVKCAPSPVKYSV
jgi:hypothetical protein